jgi:hypothetical protein
MVAALIRAIGDSSGAHVNPAVTVALASRGTFPWHRVPGYLLAQFLGAFCAASALRLAFGDAGGLGATTPAPWAGDGTALAAEAVLTFGLLTVILAAASGPRGTGRGIAHGIGHGVGRTAAIAIGGYVALARSPRPAPMGQPRQRRVDEPRPQSRPRTGLREPERLVDLRRRAASRRPARGGCVHVRGARALRGPIVSEALGIAGFGPALAGNGP